MRARGLRTRISTRAHMHPPHFTLPYPTLPYPASTIRHRQFAEFAATTIRYYLDWIEWLEPPCKRLCGAHDGPQAAWWLYNYGGNHAIGSAEAAEAASREMLHRKHGTLQTTVKQWVWKTVPSIPWLPSIGDLAFKCVAVGEGSMVS